MNTWFSRAAAFAAVAFCAVSLVSCNKPTETKTTQTTTQASQAPAAPATTPAAPTKIEATLVEIDTCKVAIMTENGLTDQSARQIPAGTTYKFKGVDVTVTGAGGIWAGCEATLENPLSVQLANAIVERDALKARIAKLDDQRKEIQLTLNTANVDLTAINARIDQAKRDLASQNQAPAPSPAAQASAAAPNPATSQAPAAATTATQPSSSPPAQT